MIKEGMTIMEAAERWVEGFSRIPSGICEKLLELNIDEIREITPPSRYDRVYITDGEYYGNDGEIVGRREGRFDAILIVRLDGEDREVDVLEEDVEVYRDGLLPMWGTLWAFGDSIDDWWLEECDGLRLMADCGFRIYEQEDYGYIFGIDGAGYSFYESHFIPLYRARGLHWHDPDTEK